MLMPDVSPHWVHSRELYRRYQLANAVHATHADTYRNEALRYVSRQSHGELIYANSIGFLTGEACSYYALLLAHSGKPADTRRQIERALKFEPEREDIAYNVACAYSLISDTTLALQWLQTAVERGHLELWWAKVDPDLDPLRNLPRFKAIMADWDNRIKKLLDKSKKDT